MSLLAALDCFYREATTTTYSVSDPWMLTAANGDQLLGTSEGIDTRADATHVSWVVDHTSTGGTGRFADASTTFTVIAVSTTVAVEGGNAYSTLEATFDGQLSW